MKWNDSKLTEGVGSGKFFKFKAGLNTIRIVSETEVIAKHFFNKKNIVCEGKENNCAGCASGNKPNVKWLCWVIDRADNTIKQAELGYTVVKAIGDLAQSPEYSFDGLPPYDLLITRSGEGMDTEYTVMPSRKDRPLTEDEKEEIMDLESPVDIVAKMKHRTPEEYTETEPF